MLSIVRKLSHFIPDKLYLELKYYQRMGRFPNLNNPMTYNEKLQWLKLYNRKPEYTQMVDKYEVKKYVASKIGNEYIIPTIGVWDKFENIDFDKLPEQFVLKCTHDSGGLVICKSKSKLDMENTRKKIEKCLKKNYYWHGREWPYKNVKPRIIAEKYMEDSITSELRDYKFFCFNGNVEFCLVCSDRQRNLKLTFYDKLWNVLPFKRQRVGTNLHEEKPVNYDLMIELAEKLSKDIPSVRIDFYEVNGNVYFGEITFFPASGFEKFDPDEWDYKIGELIVLPKEFYN